MCCPRFCARLRPSAVRVRIIDVFAIVKQIVDTKAQFRSLAEPCADTGTSTGRLMIAVLGGLADVERDLVLPARRSMRVTVTTSPGAREWSILRSSR
jgi:DNA invertase Pin-like site-specific DNA recombinase